MPQSSKQKVSKQELINKIKKFGNYLRLMDGK